MAQLKLSQLELTGFLHMGETVRVSLFDKIGHTSVWMEEGRFFGDVMVEAIDVDAMAVVLSQNGNRTTLAFKKPKIVRLRNGPLRFERNSDADISFDAMQIMLFERGQELADHSKQ